MNYSVNLGEWNNVFIVPTAVVDEHLKMAGSAQLKVLLYLLRHSGESIDSECISKAVGLAAADVADSLNYWIESGILKKSGGELIPSCNDQELIAQPEILPVTKPVEHVKPQRIPSAPTRPSHEECAKLLENYEIRQLVGEAQKLFGGMMKRGDIDILVSLPTWTGLPVSVILMIVNYCCSIDKKSLRYIEKVAISWSDKGIDTTEKADAFLSNLTVSRTAWNRVKTILGIPERRATDKEMTFCSQWINNWGFSEEMIKEAYDRCVHSTGKLSMSYMNKILERWVKAGIYTKNDIEKAETAPKKTSTGTETKKTKTTKRSTSYDMNDLERKLNEDMFEDWGGN